MMKQKFAKKIGMPYEKDYLDKKEFIACIRRQFYFCLKGNGGIDFRLQSESLEILCELD